MNKKWSLKLCLICVIMSLMLVASCGKKKIATDGASVSGGDTINTTDNGTDDSSNTSTDTSNDEGTAGDDNAVRESGKNAGSGEADDLANNIFFDYDSFEILDSQRATLEAQAKWMQENSEATVTIEGHCDERGTNEYNLALGDRRAVRAKSFLEKLGIAASRMETVSYGEERPSAVGHTEEAWAKNRRAYFADK